MQVKYRPWECPTCLQPEGSDPGNLQFYWEAPLKVKVDKLRDYEPQELKKWLRSDGTYRLTFSVTSTDSQMPINNGAGIQEGYAPKDLKFRPELEEHGFFDFAVIAPDRVCLASMRDANVGEPHPLGLESDVLEKALAGENLIAPHLAGGTRAGGRPG
ncbi:MAG: hypothetical protein HYT80_06950, partial [Euryarchaeota archaeon]|nr:hypothetical protein [Euryarchaeota archaeon]